MNNKITNLLNEYKNENESISFEKFVYIFE